jgi:hypothetical protein
LQKASDSVAKAASIRFEKLILLSCVHFFTS